MFAFIALMLLISEIPSSSEIIASIEAAQKRRLIATLQEFEKSQAATWLRLVPSVGVQPVFANDGVRLAPSISISIGNFIGAAEAERMRRNKRRSIEMKIALETEAIIASALTIRREAAQKYRAWRRQAEKLKIERKLFTLDSLAFVNRELSPRQFYQAELRLINAEQATADAEDNFNAKLYLLFQIAKLHDYEKN